MHAARHQEVARAFRRGLREDRRLDLVEALLVEVLPDRHRDAVAQADVVLQRRTAQVEVAIAQPHFFGDVLVLGDRERRRFRLVEHAQFVRAHLDFAGRQVRVDGFGRAALDLADDARRRTRSAAAWPRSSSASSPSTMTWVMPWRSRTSMNSSDAEIADAVHPSEQDGSRADVGGAQRAAGMSACQRTELFSHVHGRSRASTRSRDISIVGERPAARRLPGS